MTETLATATTHAARAHARAQSGIVTDGMPTVPASAWPAAPTGRAASLVWAETVPGGRYTSKVLARGTRLRLRDIHGAACANLLLFRADAPWERLNVADTVKVPWQAYLGAGHPLLSRSGPGARDHRRRHLRSPRRAVRHHAHCAANTAKYGAGELHSASPAGRELFTLAAAKHGLAPRDLPPSLSFFHGVRVEADGTLTSTGSAGPDTYVDLLLHLPVIVLIANTAHPLDPGAEFPTSALEVLAWTCTRRPRRAPRRPTPNTSAPCSTPKTPGLPLHSGRRSDMTATLRRPRTWPSFPAR